MRTLYIAGFFAPTLDQVRASARSYVDERSLVLIGQRPDRQLDINALKSDLFDQLTRGCEQIRICAFVFRKQEHVLNSLKGVISAANARFPGAAIELRTFPNAQDFVAISKEIEDFCPTRALSYPKSLDGLEEWFSSHFPDKLVIHPRASRGLKQCQYLDTNKIYAALTLLAQDYHAMRTALQADATRASGTFSNRLLELGLELSPSISSTRAGEQGDDYKVQYPIGGLNKRTLDLHLKLGSDRDERWCLRIYFFWDEDLSKVVVGWLPSHLGTRSS